MLGGIPRSLPALLRAQRMSERASRVGFDWRDRSGSWEKVEEEVGELKDALAAEDDVRIEHELGDLLFALVNLARHSGINAEHALRCAGDRFEQRFGYVEERVRRDHGGWASLGGDSSVLPLDVLDTYWEEAKREER